MPPLCTVPHPTLTQGDKYTILDITPEKSIVLVLILKKRFRFTTPEGISSYLKSKLPSLGIIVDMGAISHTKVSFLLIVRFSFTNERTPFSYPRKITDKELKQ